MQLSYPMFRTLLITFALVASLSAQSALDKSLVFTGTTATAGAETFAWLVWQPSDPLLIAGKNVSIYRKSGNATAAAPYSRISIVEPAADARLIQSLFPVAQKLGQNLAELDTVLTEMMKDAMPSGAVTTAEKISALLVGAHGNAANMQRVILLGRQNPAIAMCGGFGFADKINAVGVVTYELREYNLASGADVGVLGRVTVDPAAVLVLPAPGKPFEVKDESVKGNVNISMRWSTPNALRDLSPLQYGYDVYRVPKAVVLARGWDAAPPASVASLLTGAGAVKVNRLAVLPPSLLDAAAAANAADTTTVFLNDDNDRFNGGTVFPDAQEFGWFVVARDLLGRGGQPSEVMLAMIKDRMPPNPPQKVKVRNLATYNGTVRDQRFLVEWSAPDPVPGETISGYAVYRWRTPADIAKKGRHLDPITKRPDANLIAILPPAQTSFTDNGTTIPPVWAEVDLPPPSVPVDDGKTFYYTVRAFDGSVSANLSGHSAPAWGVLRDREGPAGAAGGLNLRCFSPSLTWGSFIQVPLNGLTDDQGHFVFTCASTLPRGLDWAEFQLEVIGGLRVDMGRAYFTKNGAGNLVAALRKTVPNYIGDGRAWCRVGTKGGGVSDWVSSGLQFNTPPPLDDNFILALWNVALNGLAVDGLLCGWKHEVVDPSTGATTDVTGTFTPTLGSKEYKVYRRVNNSDQTLIASGTVPSAAPITWTDPSPPASNATVCYFLQLFDEHGNAGPLVQQGECVESGDATYLPTPMLEDITATTPLNPRMKVSWFCNTAGVERFEVWVARASGDAPGNTNSGLSADLALLHPNEIAGLDDAKGLDFSVFETGLARHLTIGGTPHFTFTLPVTMSDDYTVMVRAVGPGAFGARVVGQWSNLETFAYATRKLGLSVPVPWPDRPLPTKADFHDGVESLHIGGAHLAPWKGNAVRIGEYKDQGQGTSFLIPDNVVNPAGVKSFVVPTTRDLENYLYTNDAVAQAEPLEAIPGLILPIALYRVQVTNTKYPTVPGDIVQVSPLMEKITQFDSAGKNNVIDPFIAILSSAITGLPRTITGSDQDILLIDRQPVLKGARYKYLVVRFSPTKEIERVSATNTVDVP